MHGIEAHAEAVFEIGPDGVEIEQALHQLGIVGDGVDDLDRHAGSLDGADHVDVDRIDV